MPLICLGSRFLLPLLLQRQRADQRADQRDRTATACAAGDATRAGVLAHKLKSSARSVGALALGEICAEMEAAGKAGETAMLKKHSKVCR